MLTKETLQRLSVNLRAGRFNQIISECSAHIKQYPKNGQLYEFIGLAHLGLGNTTQGKKFLEKALKLRPNLELAKLTLSQIHIANKDFTRAIRLLKALTHNGASINSAPRLLGKAYYLNGQFFESEKELDAALVINPSDTEAMFYLASISRKNGEDEKASERYKSILKVMPQSFEACYNLATIYRDAKNHKEAFHWYSAAIDIDATNLNALINRGVLFAEANKEERALDDFKAAIEAAPKEFQTYLDLGKALVARRSLDTALKMFDIALEFSPEFSDAKYSQFCILALQGRYEEALALHEMRFDKKRKRPVNGDYAYRIPSWDGAPVKDKHLLIFAEQGHGDAIMFIRFIKHVQSVAGRISLAVHEPLYDLIASQKWDLDLLKLPSPVDWKSADGNGADLRCPLMSLPYFMGIDQKEWRRQSSYLSVPSQKQQEFESYLGSKSRPRIGFAFKGNPDHLNDQNRSIQVEEFLSSLPVGGDYHFLGVHLTQKERRLLAKRPDVKIHTKHLKSFLETAALVKSMDHVVTVDTSIAHLSGSLGVNTTVLLAYDPDWRWGLEKGDSFWYGSLELLRQPTIGDWNTPLKKMSSGLSDYFVSVSIRPDEFV